MKTFKIIPPIALSEASQQRLSLCSRVGIFFMYENFPVWKESPFDMEEFYNPNSKLHHWRLFRNSCSMFTSRKDVRELILSKCNYQCVRCKTFENLTIDHIVPVLKHFKDETFFECNWQGNLQVLCKSCNSKKGYN